MGSYSAAQPAAHIANGAQPGSKMGNLASLLPTLPANDVSPLELMPLNLAWSEDLIPSPTAPSAQAPAHW
jgi:hypothetical protein